MGQCTSRKSAGAFAYSTEGRPMASKNMSQKHHRFDTDDNQIQDDNKEHNRRTFSRGLATSFGFKRITPSAIPVPRDITPSNKNTTQHIIDSNGNDDPFDSLDTTELHPSGRSTPRLAPPKKESSTTRLNRFGFRNQSNNVNRTSRLPQGNTLINTENKNNNVEKEKVKKTVSIAPTLPKAKQSLVKTFGPSKVKAAKSNSSQQQLSYNNAPSKLTFHTTQLPKPQLPLRFAESKNAKTAANINRKVSSSSQRSEEAFSSKEGSVTEDSGVGSHTSGTNINFTGDSDTLHGIELMDSSPTFGVRRNKNNTRARNLELIVSGKNFDVRDLDDCTEDGVVTEVAVIPLPRLPSVFATNNSVDSRSTNSSVFGNVSTGMVRERTREFERQIDKNRRKISVTSSEGFSEDYGEEEKSFRDRSCTEKVGQGASRLFSSAKSFRESHVVRKPLHSDKDSSPTSSDDQDWEQGGEAMADICSSIGFSSSDESRDKEISPILLRTGINMTNSCTGAIPKDNSRSVLLNREESKQLGESTRTLINKNIPIETNSYQMHRSSNGAIEKDNVRSVLLTIEDTKFVPFKQVDSSRTSTNSMMTSSSSMSSSSSAATRPDFLKSSLFLKDEPVKSTATKNVTSDLISPILTNSILTNSARNLTPRDELKSVLLSIEDPKFAAVAAASSGTLLDDETSPVDSLISSYTESEEIISKHKAKTSKSSTDSKDINEKSTLSPASPGTPTNASLSLSEGRDFLIDDEIADQPALIFNDTVTSVHSIDRMRNDNHHNLSMFSESDRLHSEHQNISDNITLVDSTPKLMRRALRSCEGSPAMARARLLSRTASVDTLSPCESIASDDLMMDFDHSQSSGIEDSTDRLHLNEGNALHSLNEATLISELENQDSVVARQWSSLLGTHSNKDSSPYSVVRTNNFLRSQTNTPNSVPDSPRSIGRSGLRGSLTNNSPLLRSARTTHGSPAAYDSDDSLRVSQGSMVNDIVGIKTMLIKLKRVLQETDEDFLMRNEPLNPFENQNSMKNGLYNGLSNEQQSDLDSVDSMDLNSCTSMEMAELRRQIEFLQSQLEDKDRTVHHLQNQISKYNLDKHQRENTERVHETCNAATQTDRVRPLSAGPSLLQTLPSEGGMGPLVSANEHFRRSRPQSMVESHPSSANILRTPPLKLWRKPGEPPPPTSRYPQQGTSLPRRARSRSRPSTATT